MKKYFLAVFLMALTGGMMTSCGDDDTSEYDGYKFVIRSIISLFSNINNLDNIMCSEIGNCENAWETSECEDCKLALECKLYKPKMNT